jgi:hypothetical protein
VSCELLQYKTATSGCGLKKIDASPPISCEIGGLFLLMGDANRGLHPRLDDAAAAQLKANGNKATDPIRRV